MSVSIAPKRFLMTKPAIAHFAQGVVIEGQPGEKWWS